MCLTQRLDQSDMDAAVAPIIRVAETAPVNSLSTVVRSITRPKRRSAQRASCVGHTAAGVEGEPPHQGLSERSVRAYGPDGGIRVFTKILRSRTVSRSRARSRSQLVRQGCSSHSEFRILPAQKLVVCAGSDGFEMRRPHAIKPARHRASDSLFGDRRGPVGSCVGSFRIICA